MTRGERVREAPPRASSSISRTRTRRPHRRGGGLSLLLAGWALAACGGGAVHEGDPSLSATIQLSPTPPMVGDAVLRVTATDGGSPMGPEARVEVTVGDEGNPVTLRHEAGAWLGTARFQDPGSTVLVVRIESPDGRRATLRIPTTVSRGLGG